ncbi:thrombospondin type-1 domain-containing protein 4-like isoform X1 [Brienomyrus brachyistius]|uniref:thrombospondin type-1 domain-containing protein 4-like isoform X1 n=2 Tax=Brienomyrus brachyistius TaxID=42636 RepID=UPI0020B39E34|nr:thrombospondin type-1 domain-containing protein 4-like isoform X1 [Brienomyrus brachyistius]
MIEISVWTLRALMLLVLLLPSLLECQHITVHRKVPTRPEYQLDHGTREGGVSGSWGHWGPWGDCSRSCGGGVQEQTRSCLLIDDTLANHPPGQAPLPLTPGGVVPMLHSSGPLHRNQVWHSHNSTHPGSHRSMGSHPQGPRNHRPGHRGGHGRIVPGRYGYGRMPYVMPLQTDTGQQQSRPRGRRRRQGPSVGPQPKARHRGQSSGFPLQTSRDFSSPQQQPTGSQAMAGLAGASLYQAPSSQLGSYLDNGPSVARSRPPPAVCPGAQKLHRMCNTNACPPPGRHIREVQCSSYNSRPFMGRLYQWEPFTDAQGDQHCELNCRAVGFRFYVRQSEKVIDGTPCGRNETSVCIDGSCQSLGCDGFLGSGKLMDTCGVCGGDNTTCRLVSGIFKHSMIKMGYHKIVEIPEGATKINVTEMIKSRNYLALRSRSGRSIVNGQWAIDRPGKYEGVGTMFTYRRPNEISSTAGESLLAEGPTNEILDVYMIYQQPNPGIHYEFLLPAENPQDTKNEGNTLDGEGAYMRPGGSDQEGYHHPRKEPNNQVLRQHHAWKRVGFTDCTVSCGRGSRRTVFHCVHSATLQPVADSLCDRTTRPSPQEEPCNVEPCPAFWDIGEWSECSRTCGPGQQHRQVLCRQTYANRTLNVHTGRCQDLERPETTTSCQLRICSEWQIRSDWSTCSVPCGVGQRSREVRCISNAGDFVADEECNMKLRPSDTENCDMGPCAKSWFFTEWGSRCSADCGFGVKTRGVLCLTNHVSSLPLDGCGPERPPESQVCNNGPCENQIEWFTGQWSQCSADCGHGRQQREVVCLMKSDKGFSVLPPYECSSLDQPPTQQSCQLKACSAKWYHTEWSACSKTCEGGFRVREVRCLSNDMVPSEACDARLRPEERESCSPEPCAPEIDENCRDKYYNCNVVVQARLCVYTYYQTTCCASCTRGAQRHSGYWGAR